MSLREEQFDVLNSPVGGAVGRPCITLRDVGRALQELREARAGVVETCLSRVGQMLQELCSSGAAIHNLPSTVASPQLAWN